MNKLNTVRDYFKKNSPKCTPAYVAHKCLFLFAPLLMLFLADMPVQAVDFSFGNSHPGESNSDILPTGCSGNDGIYSCTGALSLGDGDTIRVVSPSTITFSAAFATTANNKINLNGSASDLTLIVIGAFALGPNSTVNANMHSDGAVVIGPDCTMHGSIATTAGAVYVDVRSVVNGSISTVAAAVAVAAGGQVIGDITTSSGAISVGDGGSVTGSIRTIVAGAIDIATNAKVIGDLSTSTGAISVGANAKVTGMIDIDVSGGLLISAGAVVIGNSTVASGTIDVGAGSNVTGSIGTTIAGAITVNAGAHITGNITTLAGAISAGANIIMIGDIITSSGAVTLGANSIVYGSIGTTVAGAVTVAADTKVTVQIYSVKNDIITLGAGAIIASVCCRITSDAVCVVNGSLLPMPPACNSPLANESSCTFDAWDSFRSINDRNISTKIVNKPFTLTIAALNITNTAFEDFNGIACATIVNNAGNSISGWNKLLFNSAQPQSATSTFTLNRAIGGNGSAGIQIIWKKDAPEAIACENLTDANTTFASDRFSIRPKSFDLNASNTVAGVDFNITFRALIDGDTTESSDYNETEGVSFDLTYAEDNSSCITGIFTPSKPTFSFVNGTQTITTRYSEVGLLDLNISDLTKPCADRYTNVDCDDLNVSDGINYTADLLPIGLRQKQITITPHHFDVNATLINGSNGFTYLSNDLNMSAVLNVTVSAKNAENNTTTNYDKGCYAKSTTVVLPHSAIPSPLSSMLYAERLSGMSGISKDANITLSFDNTIFTHGTAPLALSLNFDRNETNPVNPFDFNITSVDVNDSDVKGTGTPLETATFVYGRARPYDIRTNEVNATTSVEFEVYSLIPTGYVTGMPQNVLHWYRNLDHSTSAAGNVIRGGFSAGATDIAVNTSSEPKAGIQTIAVASQEDRIVHLDISPWLWYSPKDKNEYNYTAGCTQHPCFIYDYTNPDTGIKGVTSGTFSGSDFKIAPAKKITTKGAKVFR